MSAGRTPRPLEPLKLSPSLEKKISFYSLLLSTLAEPVAAKDAVKPSQAADVQTPLPAQELVRTVWPVYGRHAPTTRDGQGVLEASLLRLIPSRALKA